MKYLVALSALAVLLASQVRADQCTDENKCKAPSCRCMNSPGPMSSVSETPQFVMLTFDDAINVVNYDPLYKDLFTTLKRKNPGGCNIAATFFTSHEYNNYAQAHQLYRYGSEIAIHSISHVSSTESWKKFDRTRWLEEVDGMRNMISKFGQIPKKDIKGFRAPFLQTAGDTTFQLLHSLQDVYDCSMPSQTHVNPPIWPYTLDYGFTQDCVVQPCPTAKYPGLWIVPMVSLLKLRELEGGEIKEIPCAMADGCLPYPETEADTFDYFMTNFNRHYTKNRAPFPLFLHAAWLMDENRKKGYLKFVDEILKKPGVYIVTIQEVLDYIKQPVQLTKYVQKNCVKTPSQGLCTEKGNYCNYDVTPLSGPRIMYSCSACPQEYPWLGNNEGKKTGTR